MVGTMESSKSTEVPYVLEIELNKINQPKNDVDDVPEPIVLNNIFFESGKATLKSSSDFELDRLAMNLRNKWEWKLRFMDIPMMSEMK